MTEISIANPTGPDKSQVQVISRAIAILHSLEDDAGGLSLAQIAHRTGLARSTVQRIVGALQEGKFVIAASPNGRVTLGPAILRLADAVRWDIVSVVRPMLSRLSAELRETVDLAVIRKDKLLFVDQVTGSQRLRAVSAVGETFPLYCTANGKAYLASLDDRAIERLVGKSFKARTPGTTTDLSTLLLELEGIRKSGVAFDREEHTFGISAVGISFLDSLGNPAAISVPIPTQRFEQTKSVIADVLFEARSELRQIMKRK